MGHPSSLPLQHLLWANNMMIEYIGKLEAQAASEITAAEVKEWVKARQSEYESKFGKEIAEKGYNLVGLRKAIASKFRNTKHRFTHPTSSTPASAISVPAQPFAHLVPPPPPATARQLFADQMADTINEAVKGERGEAGLDRSHHAGMYQAELKRLWDAADQSKWEEMARSPGHSATVAEARDENQNMFADNVRQLFGSLMDDNQLGNSAFHLLYGFYDAQGTMKSGVIEVLHDDSAPGFASRILNYGTVIGENWGKYVLETVPRNATLSTSVVVMTDAQKQFKADKDGCPIFPTHINVENCTDEVLLNMFSTYFQAHWDYTRAQVSGSIDAIPWDCVSFSSDMPDGFFTSEELLKDRTHLVQLFQLFKALQPPFRIFEVPSLDVLIGLTNKKELIAPASPIDTNITNNGSKVPENPDGAKNSENSEMADVVDPMKDVEDESGDEQMKVQNDNVMTSTEGEEEPEQANVEGLSVKSAGVLQEEDTGVPSEKDVANAKGKAQKQETTKRSEGPIKNTQGSSRKRKTPPTNETEESAPSARRVSARVNAKTPATALKPAASKSLKPAASKSSKPATSKSSKSAASKSTTSKSLKSTTSKSATSSSASSASLPKLPKGWVYPELEEA